MDAFEENSQEEEAAEDDMPQDGSGDEDLFQPSPEQMEKICAAITQAVENNQVEIGQTIEVVDKQTGRTIRVLVSGQSKKDESKDRANAGGQNTVTYKDENQRKQSMLMPSVNMQRMMNQRGMGAIGSVDGCGTALPALNFTLELKDANKRKGSVTSTTSRMKKRSRRADSIVSRAHSKVSRLGSICESRVFSYTEELRMQTDHKRVWVGWVAMLVILISISTLGIMIQLGYAGQDLPSVVQTILMFLGYFGIVILMMTVALNIDKFCRNHLGFRLFPGAETENENLPKNALA